MPKLNIHTGKALQVQQANNANNVKDIPLQRYGYGVKFNVAKQFNHLVVGGYINIERQFTKETDKSIGVKLSYNW